MICYVKYLKRSAFLFWILIFSIDCSENPSEGKEEEKKEEEQNKDEEFILEGHGYPDDYSDWYGFAYCNLWSSYNLHDPSCLNDGEWTYCFSTDGAYSGLDRMWIMVRVQKEPRGQGVRRMGVFGIPDGVYMKVYLKFLIGNIRTCITGQL